MRSTASSRRPIPPPPRSGSGSGGVGVPPRSNGGFPLYRKNPSKTAARTKWLFVTTMLCALSFYSGLILGMHGCNLSDNQDGTNHLFDDARTETRFPKSVKSYAAGMSRVRKQDFVKAFDIGVPIDNIAADKDDVLILYNHERALPFKDHTQTKSSGVIPQMGSREATKNCQTLKIILTGTGDQHQCMALVGNWEDYYIQKWMRLPDKGNMHPSLPLRHVSKSHNARNAPMRIPDVKTTRNFMTSVLEPYLANLDHTLASLAPVAHKAAVQNSLVVMVCNRGQVELLLNFVCNARAKQLDTSSVLLFATDRETRDLAEGLGLTVFYDQTLFGDFSSQAAKRYGDKHFRDMMFSKVYCVQLLNMLGYNVLFQDADVIWFKNPLDYFLKTEQQESDIYFQDDGARSPRYAPYSPNTGFYFVRNNERTVYFFSCFLRMADMISMSGSHQSALNQIMSQHVSWRGLRVKVFARQSDPQLFPGGYTFHQRDRKWMKDFMQGKHDPYIFHMSWTQNKNDKIKYYQQMGEWYLSDKCFAKTAGEIMFESTTASSLETACCSAEVLFSCHYRDKPSKQPCKDSPPIDNGKPSFW